MSADIVHRLTLWAARQPRTDGAKLVLEAINVIESLRLEVRTQRHEIAQHVNVRNALLEMDRPPEMNFNGVDVFK
jgi:hypothetical protein